MGRSEQIAQALLNLMTNAFEALQNSRNGWVTIDVQTDDAKIYLAVTDNGCGIKPEIKTKLMEPFFTTKEVGSGPGLGLSTALGIVKEHGGDLHLDEHSEWTKFVITLPRLPGESLKVAS
jgi:C4-dicarboxylate-specific signal transduction histidine kinase